MATRAKFVCESVLNRKGNYQGARLQQDVTLVAVCSDNGKQEEDNQFAEATPNGKITITISNEKAIDTLQPGKSYYIDFIPVE